MGGSPGACTPVPRTNGPAPPTSAHSRGAPGAVALHTIIAMASFFLKQTVHKCHRESGSPFIKTEKCV